MRKCSLIWTYNNLEEIQDQEIIVSHHSETKKLETKHPIFHNPLENLFIDNKPIDL